MSRAVNRTGGVRARVAALGIAVIGRAAIGRAAIGIAAIGASAGCAVLPSPEPLPDSFVPEATTSVDPGALATASNGFTLAEQAAIRLRVADCTSFGNGTGWIVGEHTVVTNSHVIEGATAIELTAYDGTELTATRSFLDPTSDLAIVVVEEELAPVLSIAAADPSGTLDDVVVVGYPRAEELTAFEASFVRIVDDELREHPDDVYLLNGHVEPGNSGSAVVNRDDGTVVGVIYAGDDGDASWAVSWESVSDFLMNESGWEVNLAQCED